MPSLPSFHRVGTLLLASVATGLVVAGSTLSSQAHEPEPQNFQESGLRAPIETVDCTLLDGTESTCLKLELNALPDGTDIGPFCPSTLDDVGGIWDWTGDKPGVYRVDADFLTLLFKFGYEFFSDTGEVHISDISKAEPAQDNTCINVALNENVEVTALIPAEPRKADAPTDLGTVAKIGVALDGIPIFADAPTIQSTGHMPALDVCGGHVDPGGWYHWHATATDVQGVLDAAGVEASCGIAQNAGEQFAYAFDGYPIYGNAEPNGSTPVNLDVCKGHETTELGYHYHAGADFPNLPTCLVGVTAQDNFSTTGKMGIGSAQQGGPGGPGGPNMDFTALTAELGVDETALMNALRDAGGPPPDLAAVAETLGTSEDILRAVMPARP